MRSATSATTAASSPTPIRPIATPTGSVISATAARISPGRSHRRRRRRRARCLRQLRRRGQRRPGERRRRRFRRRLRPLPPQPAGHGDGDGDGLGDICDPCPRGPVTRPTGDGDGLGDACDNCPVRRQPGPGRTATATATATSAAPVSASPTSDGGGDSDCDGAVDEDAAVGQACGTGLRGSCARRRDRLRRTAARSATRPATRSPRSATAATTTATASSTKASATPAVGCGVAPRETCNGLDDDCDGVDDGAPCPGSQVCAYGECREPAGTTSATATTSAVRGRVHRPLRARLECDFGEICDPQGGVCRILVRRARLQRRAHLSRRPLRGGRLPPDGCPEGDRCCAGEACEDRRLQRRRLCRRRVLPRRCLPRAPAGPSPVDSASPVSTASASATLRRPRLRRWPPCDEGECRRDPCADVVCPANFACIDGQCEAAPLRHRPLPPRHGLRPRPGLAAVPVPRAGRQPLRAARAATETADGGGPRAPGRRRGPSPTPPVATSTARTVASAASPIRRHDPAGDGCACNTQGRPAGATLLLLALPALVLRRRRRAR
jgi:hypothetical protein